MSFPPLDADSFSQAASETTHDINVSVRTAFQPQHSSPHSSEFIFAYEITIENHSRLPVKLMRRHWLIWDSTGENREVEGEGIVGQQPELQPGGRHTYTSVCNLHSDLGRMKGSYLMQRSMDGTIFRIRIPEFTLCAPNKLN